MTSKGTLWHLRWIVPVAALLFLGGFTVIWWAELSRGNLPTLGSVPPFSMTAQNGQPFGSNDINGKVAIIYFGFTACRSICPVTNTHIGTLYQAFPGNENLRFVFISVDPTRDSLEVLASFATRWGATDHRWVFLRAPIDTVAQFCEKGLMLPADELPGGHTARFTLIDHQGRIRGYYDGMETASVKILRDHIARLLREIS